LRRDSPPASRTEEKILLQGSPADRTLRFLSRPSSRVWPGIGPRSCSAAGANQERFSPLDREKGEKKKAQVVVHPLEKNLGMAASGTYPGMIFHAPGPRLYPGYEKEHPSLLSFLQRPALPDCSPLIVSFKPIPQPPWRKAPSSAGRRPGPGLRREFSTAEESAYSFKLSLYR